MLGDRTRSFGEYQEGLLLFRNSTSQLVHLTIPGSAAALASPRILFFRAIRRS